MKHTIQALVLDMDGTMVDTEPVYKRAWQGASEALGYPLSDQSYARLVGRPTPDCERELMSEFGMAFPLDRFRARWRQLWRDEVRSRGIATKPGLAELLTLATSYRLPVAVATSSEAEHAAVSLRHAGLEGRFDAIVTGDEVPHGKPSPDIYLEAARRLRVTPAECIAIEDSEAGILAVSRAGMCGLLIPDWIAPSPAAAAAAYRVLASLHDACVAVDELLSAHRRP